MEVIGAVAATTQLIGTAIGLLDSIAQLREFLQHAPARYQGWRDDLAVLGDTISDIQLNPALHTRQIGRIIDAMGPKIETLTVLCSCYTSGSEGAESNFIRKLNRAFSARAVESRILKSFESLEHDKTTLILTISTLNKSAPVSSSAQIRRDTSTTTQSVKDKMNNNTELISNHAEDNVGQGTGRHALGMRGSLTHLQTTFNASSMSSPMFINHTNHTGIVIPQRYALFLELLQRRQETQRNPRNTGAHDSNNASTPGVHGGQQSSFRGYMAIGDDCLCGDTTGRGINMDDAWIVGDRSAHGTHPAKVAKAFLKRLRRIVPARNTQ
ncbi:hypothetical protein GGS26DRAFT_152 [Hypomontagnella submonticulosa]|nr:hypothetical protein GGS26DRAFT_152 [Hypomontagnella submonticulosa]